MSIFDNLSIDKADWLKLEGPHNELVLSSRIRLARNLGGFPFSQWASTGDLNRVIDQVLEAIDSLPGFKQGEKVYLQNLDKLKKQVLQERHLISKGFSECDWDRVAFIGYDQSFSLMINEEDHIRMQMLVSGLNLQKVWDELNTLDDILEEKLKYAFSDKLGYLTACPTNVGTGIRCSVMIHLPGLVLSKKIEKVLSAVTKLGLTVRGLYGEGTEISGHLFQISNQRTLGLTEQEIIDKIQTIVNKLVQNEREAQTGLFRDNKESTADRIWRAYGIMSNAHVISYQETIELLSYLRFGKNVGILPELSLDILNELLLCTRPAHLQTIAGRRLEARERDVYRARYIREKLQCDSTRSSSSEDGENSRFQL